LQANPEEQRSPTQQGWPLPPQAPQAFLAVQTLSTAQVKPMGLQVVLPPARVVTQQPVLQLPEQQGWKSPPQPAHCCEARHRSPPVQLLPTATQVCFWVSQQPAEQVSFAQQGWPGEPQALQSPAEQTVPAALQMLPGQQGWPAPPQDWHEPR